MRDELASLIIVRERYVSPQSSDCGKRTNPDWALKIKGGRVLKEYRKDPLYILIALRVSLFRNDGSAPVAICFSRYILSTQMGEGLLCPGQNTGDNTQWSIFSGPCMDQNILG